MQHRVADVAAHVFDVHAVVREEAVVGELIVFLGKEHVELIAELGFGFGSDYLALAKHELTKEAPDG